MKELLLLHGAIGAKAQLQSLADKLPTSDFRIHTLSFSGHGGEAMPEHFSIEQFAKDVIHYLDKNKINEINIFGYSMGGYVALYLAKYKPERIKKVMTFATKFEWSPEIAQKEIKLLNPTAIETKLPAFATQLAQRHQPNDWKTVLSKTAELLISMGKNQPLKPEDFKGIEQRIMIGIGDRDTMVSLEETVEVYRKLKNAGLFVLSDTPHPIEKINAERLARELVAFF